MGNDFLEGNYDSGKEDGQAKEDNFQAARIEAWAERLENEKKEERINAALADGRLLSDSSVAVKKFFSNYGNDENEYLMDGAILTCNMATTDVQIIRGTVFGIGGTGIGGERKHTRLSIPIGVSSAGNLNMATVKSHEKGKHILPFECNCAYWPDRDWEIEEIFSDVEECKKLGTCQKLMKLENDWENIIKETDYESFDTEEGEQAEVVTMMSMLFCSHGGLITPVTSGQVVGLWDVAAIACTGTGKYAKALTDDQKKMNATYIYNYFSNLGWSPQAICGMLGNIQIESGINPGAWNTWRNEQEAYGLFQCRPGQDYLKYAGLKADKANEMAENNPQWLMNSQLKFFQETLDPSGDPKVDKRWLETGNYTRLPLAFSDSGKMEYGKYSVSEYDIGDLALVFEASYERSGNGANKLRERIKAAYEWGIYFGVIDETEAENKYENGFGGNWKEDP